MRYPLSINEDGNKQEEDSSLKQLEEFIDQQKQERPVGAVIIEPISSFLNLMATPRFYKGLRRITKEKGVPLIINETKTGYGITGKMWGHLHWYLNDAPDIVTFGNNQGLAGYFSNVDYRTNGGADPSVVSAVALL